MIQNLYVCDRFCGYYDKFIKENGIHEVAVKTYPCSCSKGDEEGLFPVSIDRDNSFLICTKDYGALYAHKFWPQHVIAIGACVEHIIDGDLYRYLADHDRLIVTKEWLEDWQRHLKAMVIDGYESLQAYMADRYTMITLIAHGEDVDEGLVETLSDHVNLPFEILEPTDRVVSDRIQLLLANRRLMNQKQYNVILTRENANIKKNLIDFNRYKTMIHEVTQMNRIDDVYTRVMRIINDVFGTDDIRVHNPKATDLQIQEILEEDVFAFSTEDCLYLVIRFYDEVFKVYEIRGVSDVNPMAYNQLVGDYLARSLSNIICKREIEEAFRKTQSKMIMRDKMASLGNIAGSVAHEINNPLSFIASNLSVLRTYLKDYKSIVMAYESMSDGLPEEMLNDKEIMDEDIPELLQEMDEGVHRIGTIVKRFRSVTNIDTHGDFTTLALNDFVKDAVFLFESTLDDKATIEADLTDDAKVYGNRGELFLVIFDILENARDAIGALASDESGHIRISTGVQSSFAFIRVEDDGVGIDAGLQEKVFDPFFTTKQIGAGIGLGLTFAYDVVCHSHKGEIRLATNEKGQTECEILLPLAAE